MRNFLPQLNKWKVNLKKILLIRKVKIKGKCNDGIQSLYINMEYNICISVAINFNHFYTYFFFAAAFFFKQFETGFGALAIFFFLLHPFSFVRLQLCVVSFVAQLHFCVAFFLAAYGMVPTGHGPIVHENNCASCQLDTLPLDTIVHHTH